MKKIIVLLAFAAIGISCKEETKEKVAEATEAVTADVKESIDSTTIKAKKAPISLKIIVNYPLQTTSLSEWFLVVV